MSETLFKFFPLDPRRKFDSDEVAGIERFIRDENGSSILLDSITLEDYNGIQFIDCGTGLERVRCPKCREDIAMDVWQNAMDADYSDETGFQLKQVLQCPCSFQSQLHGLNYEAPCGFASDCLSVRGVSHFWDGWLGHYPWIGSVEARY